MRMIETRNIAARQRDCCAKRVADRPPRYVMSAAAAERRQSPAATRRRPARRALFRRASQPNIDVAADMLHADVDNAP